MSNYPYCLVSLRDTCNDGAEPFTVIADRLTYTQNVGKMVDALIESVGLVNNALIVVTPMDEHQAVTYCKVKRRLDSTSLQGVDVFDEFEKFLDTI